MQPYVVGPQGVECRSSTTRCQHSKYCNDHPIQWTEPARRFVPGSAIPGGRKRKPDVSVSVSGATTNTLGNYGGASGTTVGTTAWTVASSVIINGVTIGASNATADAGVSSGSCVRKSRSDQCPDQFDRRDGNGTHDNRQQCWCSDGRRNGGRRRATANSSTASGQLWINGIAIGSISAASTELGQIQNAANAINQVTSQSGVTAVANASTGLLVLTAADGRDIQVCSK